jgi:hypothetical protein
MRITTKFPALAEDENTCGDLSGFDKLMRREVRRK